jgi:hypothetical protein
MSWESNPLPRNMSKNYSYVVSYYEGDMCCLSAEENIWLKKEIGGYDDTDNVAYFVVQTFISSEKHPESKFLIIPWGLER